MSTGAGQAGRRTDEVVKRLPAPVERVFAALVDPDARVKWLPPEGMSGRIDAWDPRPGGGYRMTLTYDDAETSPGKTSASTDVVRARFVSIEPDARVVEAIDFESPDPAFRGTMTMTWSLRAVDGGTEVTVTACDAPEGITADDHRAGMSTSLAQLAAFVAS